MRIRFLCLIGAAALAAGCSQQGTNTAASNGPAANEWAAPEPANTAAPATTNGTTAAAGQDDYRRMAECASRLEAVARMYSAMAQGMTGGRAIELITMSSERRSAAIMLNFRAESAELIQNPNAVSQPQAEREVPRIRRETDAAIEAERRRRPFEDFAIWVGREADGCAALARPS